MASKWKSGISAKKIIVEKRKVITNCKQSGKLLNNKETQTRKKSQSNLMAAIITIHQKLVALRTFHVE